MEDNVEKCKVYLLDYLSKYRKSERQANAKLIEKGYDYESRRLAIAKAKEYGFLDDEDLAKDFVETKGKTKSKNAVRQKLLAKSVAIATINEVICDMDDMPAGRLAMEKYMKGKDRGDPKFKEKLYRHLAGKGFSYGTISKLFGELSLEIEGEEGSRLNNEP